jgi:hypothetical protein
MVLSGRSSASAPKAENLRLVCKYFLILISSARHCGWFRSPDSNQHDCNAFNRPCSKDNPIAIALHRVAVSFFKDFSNEYRPVVCDDSGAPTALRNSEVADTANLHLQLVQKPMFGHSGRVTEPVFYRFTRNSPFRLRALFTRVRQIRGYALNPKGLFKVPSGSHSGWRVLGRRSETNRGCRS